MSQGEEIWRAKMRLLRGDVYLANPTFLKFFETFMNSSSEDARLIAEGTLRCALARGDLKEALEPWLRTAKHRADGLDSSFPTLTKVIDSNSLLCPQLPPIYLLEGVARKLTLPDTLAGKAGKEFLELLLHSSSGDTTAIAYLTNAVDSFPEWKQAWAYYFLGIGHLQIKDDSDARSAGLLALARVASLPKNIQPWLSGASLIILSEEFALDGKVTISEKMLRQLQRNFPTHPLLLEGKIKIRNARE